MRLSIDYISFGLQRIQNKHTLDWTVTNIARKLKKKLK